MNDDITHQSEQASSAVEYIGVAALSTMLLSAFVTAIDAGFGERISRAIVERLIAAIAGG